MIDPNDDMDGFLLENYCRHTPKCVIPCDDAWDDYNFNMSLMDTTC
jgi:hypothetical protein